MSLSQSWLVRNIPLLLVCIALLVFQVLQCSLVILPQTTSNILLPRDDHIPSLHNNSVSAALDQEHLIRLIKESLASEQYKTTASAPPENATEAPSSRRLSCRTLMQQHKELSGGAFLSHESGSPTWQYRIDGSRELTLESCDLHRYTWQEARQCLAGEHIFMVGDSLTRYWYMSLVYFLERGEHPPRFGRPKAECTHFDANGNLVCSPEEQPNVCMEGDWRFSKTVRDPWLHFFSSIGGGDDGQVFHGRVECNCARSNKVVCKDGRAAGECCVENEVYVSAPVQGDDRIHVTVIKEDGWGDSPRNLTGFKFSDCSSDASCRSNASQVEALIQRAQNFDFDWSEPFVEALSKGGALWEQLPPATISLLNRGLWGILTPEQAKARMPVLANVTRRARPDGRCFYRTTTGSARSDRMYKQEHTYIQDETLAAGCEFLDVAHLTKAFADMSKGERELVFWDAVHYLPWVYEELNHILLNVLCNEKNVAAPSS